MLLDGVDLRAIKDKVPFAKDTFVTFSACIFNLQGPDPLGHLTPGMSGKKLPIMEALIREVSTSFRKQDGFCTGGGCQGDFQITPFGILDGDIGYYMLQ